jgi:hypothetical protein
LRNIGRFELAECVPKNKETEEMNRREPSSQHRSEMNQAIDPLYALSPLFVGLMTLFRSTENNALTQYFTA